MKEGALTSSISFGARGLSTTISRPSSPVGERVGGLNLASFTPSAPAYEGRVTGFSLANTKPFVPNNQSVGNKDFCSLPFLEGTQNKTTLSHRERSFTRRTSHPWRKSPSRSLRSAPLLHRTGEIAPNPSLIKRENLAFDSRLSKGGWGDLKPKNSLTNLDFHVRKNEKSKKDWENNTSLVFYRSTKLEKKDRNSLAFPSFKEVDQELDSRLRGNDKNKRGNENGAKGKRENDTRVHVQDSGLARLRLPETTHSEQQRLTVVTKELQALATELAVDTKPDGKWRCTTITQFDYLSSNKALAFLRAKKEQKEKAEKEQKKHLILDKKARTARIVGLGKAVASTMVYKLLFGNLLGDKMQRPTPTISGREIATSVVSAPNVKSGLVKDNAQDGSLSELRIRLEGISETPSTADVLRQGEQAINATPPVTKGYAGEGVTARDVARVILHIFQLDKD